MGEAAAAAEGNISPLIVFGVPLGLLFGVWSWNAPARSSRPNKLAVEAKRRLAIAAGFAAFMGLSLAVAYLAGAVPSFREACERHCAASHSAGYLVYHGPPGKGGVAQDARSDCECR